MCPLKHPKSLKDRPVYWEGNLKIYDDKGFQMQGPYPLKPDWIDSYVGRSPGAYIILDPNNNAVYVGRSDEDLKSRLKDYPPDDRLKFFFEHTSKAKTAFELECIWFHQYHPQSNNQHPAKSDPKWKCLACRQ